MVDDIFKELAASDNEKIQVARELFNSQNIKHKTELSEREIFMITRLAVLGKKFKIPEITLWIDQFTNYRVSLRRKGRGEFIEAIKTPPVDFGMPQPGFGSRFRGGGRF